MIERKPLLPNDPDVKIPAAVRLAGLSADELHRQAYAQEAPGEEVQNEGAGQEADQGGKAAGETAQAGAPEPQAVVQAERPVETSKPGIENGSAEQKFLAMQGRYEKAQQTIAAMSEQIAALQRSVAQMQAAPRPAEEPKESERFLTPEEINDYGEDFLNVIRKAAKEETLPVIKKYEGEIERLKQQLAGVNGYVAQNDQQRMEQTLDQAVPNWREMNENWLTNGFRDWLQLPDPYSGAIRHSLMNEAWDRRDAARVAQDRKSVV